MEKIIQEIQPRWSDLDPNFHLRHSVYYDFGAFSRISYLNANQLSADVMQAMQIGPILFREECVFRRELRMGDTITIDLELSKSKKDFSRWSIRHTIMKNGDTVAAIINVDGAWMDTAKRKLSSPPEQVASVFGSMPRTADFEWL